MISFEFDKSGDKLEIHLDNSGIKKLIEYLEFLQASATDNHVHLLTEEWGGDDLSRELQNNDAVKIHHVKILKW